MPIEYFAVILAEPGGDERFRTTVSAFTLEGAVDKAGRLAAAINAVVELVEPARDRPLTGSGN